MDCDIVLLPDPKLAHKAIAASERLECLGSHFVLEDGKYFPHASLYMARLRLADLPKAEAILRQIASQVSAAVWVARQYDFARGYVVVDYDITPQTCELQQQVIAAINPLRDGILAKDRERLKEATGVALHNYQAYGYKYIGELFHPHITLARFDDDQDEARGLLPELAEFNGRFDRIGLFELGKDNTCIRRLAAFDLQP